MHHTLGPATPSPGKLETIESYPDVIRALNRFILNSISSHEKRRFQASDQGRAAREHYKYPENWSYAGLRYRDILALSNRALELHVRVKDSWDDIANEIFIEWPSKMRTWMSFAASFMKFANVSHADEMFLGNLTETIPLGEFPETLPLGIKNILEIYRVFVADNDRLGTSCLFLAQCKDSTDQPLHPACKLGQDSDRTPQELVAYLEGWAASWRHRNITLPRSKESPTLFDFPVNLAQMRDIIDQLLQIAETVATLDAQRQTTYDRITWWWSGTPEPEHIKDYHTIVASAQNMTTQLWRQMHDLSSGVQAVGSICHAIDELATTVDKLDDPQNWIANRDALGVQVMKMSRPEEQARDLKRVVNVMSERNKKKNQWLWLWVDMERFVPVKDETE
jgi:hypothetical protein